MASIPTTTMRIDPQLKEESSRVLEDLGLTPLRRGHDLPEGRRQGTGTPVRGQEGNVEWQIRSSASKTSVLKTCADSEVTP